jgi:hypothetical protein
MRTIKFAFTAFSLDFMGKKVVWCVERRVLVEFMNAIKNVLETS